MGFIGFIGAVAESKCEEKGGESAPLRVGASYCNYLSNVKIALEIFMPVIHLYFEHRGEAMLVVPKLPSDRCLIF
jgi:hypothetical protein